MIHQTFDIKRWKNLFPLEKLRRQAKEFVEDRRRELPDEYKNASDVERHIKLMNPGGEIITSPFHLAVVEQLREECLASRNLPTVPTDVFVFARGEPQNRSVTKVGGLPFWPRARDWPMGRSGLPMTFVAQFCFADSTDLFHSLPGEILLVFADGIYLKDWRDEDANALRFEWVNRSENNLVEASGIPQTRWDLFPVYGEIHRTKDYATGPMWEKAWWWILLRRSKSPRDFFSGLGAQRALDKAYHMPYCIPIVEGTKIGGFPRWIQGDDETIPGRFLCALGSIRPVYQTPNDIMHRPYPFTNLQGPFVRARKAYCTPEEEVQTNRLLMWGDVGSLYLLLDDGGTIHWTIQFY
jgi:hypothetical protein